MCIRDRGSVVFRIIWLLTVFAYFKTLPSLYLIYVISWTLTALAGNLYFEYHYRKTYVGIFNA